MEKQAVTVAFRHAVHSCVCVHVCCVTYDLQVVYAVHANEDHRMARHILPDEIVAAIGWNTIERLWSEDAHGYGLERIAADAHAATEQCDYSMIESHAVPFYLEYIFDKQQQAFAVRPVSLALIERLLLELRRGGDSFGESSLAGDSVLKKVWAELSDCDIVCVPSVLLLSGSCTTNEWWVIPLAHPERGSPAVAACSQCLLVVVLSL